MHADFHAHDAVRRAWVRAFLHDVPTYHVQIYNIVNYRLNILQSVFMFKSSGYAFIIFVYLFFTAMIVLNTLIGIFGSSMTNESSFKAHFGNSKDDDESAMIRKIAKKLAEDSVAASVMTLRSKGAAVRNIGKVETPVISGPISSARSGATRAREHFVVTTKGSIYILCMFSLSVIECGLVAHAPYGAVLAAQYTVFAFSTVLYFLGVGMVAAHVAYTGNNRTSANSLRSWAHDFLGSGNALCHKLVEVTDGEVVAEGVILLWGWLAFAAGYPGVAALRCFRLLRVLWFFDLEPLRFAPHQNLHGLTKLVQFGVRFFEKIGSELLSSKSRGSIVLLAMFLYLSYAFGVCFWLEVGGWKGASQKLARIGPELSTPKNEEMCIDPSQCMMTFMRMAFYDGTG